MSLNIPSFPAACRKPYPQPLRAKSLRQSLAPISLNDSGSLPLQNAASVSLLFGGRKGPIYTGLFLDKDNPLKSYPIPDGWTRYAHHATIQHANDAPIRQIPDMIGSLDVIEVRQTDKVLYAVVKPPHEVTHWLSENGIKTPPWHITIATAPGVQPVEAKYATQKSEGSVIQVYSPRLELPFHAGGFPKKATVD